MKTIFQLRDEVDAIDSKILDLLSERMKLIKKIAKQKKKTNLLILDKKREEEVNKSWLSKAESLELETRTVQSILEEVLKMSKDLQGTMIK